MPNTDRQITLRFLATPTDARNSGNVSGGRVLEWIDQAGYACAVGWAGTYSVTAYVGNVRFSRPVLSAGQGSATSWNLGDPSTFEERLYVPRTADFVV